MSPPATTVSNLLSPSLISLLLAGGGGLSLLMALAGQVGWLHTPPGHLYVLMAGFTVQFFSAAWAHFQPARALRIFTLNLALYPVMLAAVVHFNPEQPQFLFASFFPVMAAFLAVSIRTGLIVTALALIAPLALPRIDSNFLFRYQAFMLIGALISAWLANRIQIMLPQINETVTRLDHMATHDPLTGALNRRGIHEQGGRAVRPAPAQHLPTDRRADRSGLLQTGQ